MRLLLINPRFPESWWSSQWALDILPEKSALNPPLGLATLAALWLGGILRTNGAESRHGCGPFPWQNPHR